MKPDKLQRYDEFRDDGLPKPPIYDRVLGRIAFEAAEISDKLNDRLDRHEQAALINGVEYKPGLADKVAIGIANILDGPL